MQARRRVRRWPCLPAADRVVLAVHGGQARWRQRQQPQPRPRSQRDASAQLVTSALTGIHRGSRGGVQAQSNTIAASSIAWTAAVVRSSIACIDVAARSSTACTDVTAPSSIATSPNAIARACKGAGRGTGDSHRSCRGGDQARRRAFLCACHAGGVAPASGAPGITVWLPKPQPLVSGPVAAAGSLALAASSACRECIVAVTSAGIVAVTSAGQGGALAAGAAGQGCCGRARLPAIPAHRHVPARQLH